MIQIDRFQYSELPLAKRDLETLLTIVRALLPLDKDRLLQVVFPGHDDPQEFRIGATSEGYFLALSYPMDDFGWSHPLILAEGDLPYEDVEQVIRGVCEEGKSTGDIPVVMEKLKDCTGEAFGED